MELVPWEMRIWKCDWLTHRRGEKLNQTGPDQNGGADCYEPH